MKRILQPLLLVLTLAFAVAPFFTPSFQGYDPGRFPVRIEDPAVQPAGYAFAIWGLIYLWLILHAGFGLLRRRDDPAFLRVAPPLTGAVALGSVWLAIAVTAPIAATLVLIAMAALAIRAFLRADPQQDRWLLSAPLAIFAGWLTAATAASTGVMLAGYGVMSDTTAALAMLLTVLAVAIPLQRARPSQPIYAATVIWAIIGIVVANWGENPTVAYAALAGAVALAALTLTQLRH